MPRSLVTGIYSLPPGNPVVSGTPVEASWANLTCSDLGDAITGSLATDGSNSMLAPFPNFDGDQLAPGITYANEDTTGWWRTNPGIVSFGILGDAIFRTSLSAGIGTLAAYSMWDADESVWKQMPTPMWNQEITGAWQFGFQYLVPDATENPVTLQNWGRTKINDAINIDANFDSGSPIPAGHPFPGIDFSASAIGTAFYSARIGTFLWDDWGGLLPAGLPGSGSICLDSIDGNALINDRPTRSMTFLYCTEIVGGGADPSDAVISVPSGKLYNARSIVLSYRFGEPNGKFPMTDNNSLPFLSWENSTGTTVWRTVVDAPLAADPYYFRFSPNSAGSNLVYGISRTTELFSFAWDMETNGIATFNGPTNILGTADFDGVVQFARPVTILSGGGATGTFTNQGISTFSATATFNAVATFNGVVGFTSTSNFTGRADFDGGLVFTPTVSALGANTDARPAYRYVPIFSHTAGSQATGVNDANWIINMSVAGVIQALGASAGKGVWTQAMNTSAGDCFIRPQTPATPSPQMYLMDGSGVLIVTANRNIQIGPGGVATALYTATNVVYVYGTNLTIVDI